MGALFSKPKLPSPPPPPPLVPTVTQSGEKAVKTTRRRSGYEKTLLTGSLVPEPTDKKPFLG